MVWHLVVRHADPAQLAEVKCDCEDCRGAKGGTYPPEGLAVSAFDDPEQARRFAEASTSAKHRYEVVPVCRISE